MLSEKQEKIFQAICKEKGIEPYNITKENLNNFIKENSIATEKQINYLKGLCKDPTYAKSMSIKITMDKMSQKQVTLLLNSLKHEYKIENTCKINLDLYKYIYTDLESDYLIGTQINNTSGKELKVMSFYNLLVIDWDNVPLYKIKEILKNDKHTWYIYQTHSGYHGYCMSKKYSHFKMDTMLYMQELHCDLIYTSFTKKVGFIIRIQKKENRYEDFIEKFICQINEFPVIKRFDELIKIKDKLMI
jgi:hypothetical protein